MLVCIPVAISINRTRPAVTVSRDIVMNEVIVLSSCTCVVIDIILHAIITMTYQDCILFMLIYETYFFKLKKCDIVVNFVRIKKSRKTHIFVYCIS